MPFFDTRAAFTQPTRRNKQRINYSPHNHTASRPSPGRLECILLFPTLIAGASLQIIANARVSTVAVSLMNPAAAANHALKCCNMYIYIIRTLYNINLVASAMRFEIELSNCFNQAR